MKDNKNLWYAPLSAQFQTIEEAMPLSRFAAIEAVLHLLALNAPDSDPTKHIFYLPNINLSVQQSA